MALVPDGLPRVESVRIDAGVRPVHRRPWRFSTAALAGLAPALSLARADLAAQLRSGGRGAIGGAARRAPARLVVAQVALAVTVVAAAGLLTRSLLRLQAVDMGLAADRLVFVQLALPQAKYADEARHLQFLNDAGRAARGGAGHRGGDARQHAALRRHRRLGCAGVHGRGPERSSEAAANPSLNLESIHPNYFATFEVALVRGRAFTAADRRGAPEVAIVSEDVAARTWPGEDPIGKRLKLGGSDSDRCLANRGRGGPAHAVSRAGGAAADALPARGAVHRRGRDARAAHRARRWRSWPAWRASSVRAVDPERAGHARGAVRGAAPAARSRGRASTRS